MLLSEIANIQLINENADTQISLRCMISWDALNIEEEYDDLSSKIKQAIGEHWKNSDVGCWDGEVDILIREIPNPSKAVLVRLSSQVKAVVDKLLLDFKRHTYNSHFEIQFLGMPKQPIGWNGDMFFYCEEKQSLSEINKYITECYTLYLNNAENVEGGVLRLLQLPNAKHLKINSDEDAKWAEIVEKHFDSDRDVIECQQELIDAGLKAFARF